MDRLGERLARGDPAAFAELYDRCAVRVHRYLVVRLGSRADADDVLQETFVRLAQARQRLARVTDTVAYVFASARNEATRFALRRVRGSLGSPAAKQIEFCEATGHESEDAGTAQWVAAALAGLEPRLREIVELKIYAGLTFHEISQVTGLPQGTAATRYRKALRKLQTQWARQKT
jgi:RNA polymerase sigma-70 factor, ECF subfamily